MWKVFILFTFANLLMGCAQFQQGLKSYELKQSLRESQRYQIERGCDSIQVGMKVEDVLVTLGDPHRKTRSFSSMGASEGWTYYRQRNWPFFVYILNDKVSSCQD